VRGENTNWREKEGVEMLPREGERRVGEEKIHAREGEGSAEW